MSKLPVWILKRRGVVEVFLLLVAGFAVYANSIGGSFVFDDVYNVKENPFVHDLRFFWSYFTDSRTLSTLPENAPYRPLSTVSFAFLWALGRGAVWVFDVYKIVLHVAVAALSLQIAKTLTRGRAANALLVGALLFIVHPSLSESVNYVSSLTSVQCALFFVAGFLAFLRKRHVLMALLAFASMLTKEEGAVFPAVLLFYSLVFKTRLTWREHLPAWLSLAAYLVIRSFLGSKTVIFGVVPWYEYLFTQFRAWVYYIYKLFAPWGYSVEHLGFGFSRSLFEPLALGSLFVFAAMCWRVYRWARPAGSRQARPFLAFGWGWYWLCLLPASSVFALSEPINEHRYYLSFALLFPAIAVWVREYRDLRFLKPFTPVVRAVVIAGLIVALGALTVRQNTVWRNAETLWTDVLKNDPENGRAMNNLGTELLAKGRYEEALALFRRSEVAMPGYKYALINQMIALTGLKRIPEARVVLQRLLDSPDAPGSVVVQYHHAKFLYEVERNPGEAQAVLDRCAAISDGKYLPCLVLQISVLNELGRPADIERVARDVLRIDPQNREGRFGLGLSLISQRKFQEARAQFEQLLAENPSDPQVLHNLAWLNFQLGNYEESRSHWQRKLQLVPGDRSAILGLKEVADKLAVAPRQQR